MGGTTNDGVVTGTSGNDTMLPGYQDADGDRIDSNDAILPGELGDDDIIYAQGGDDTVQAGFGNDLVFGGTGDDNVSGGAGNDVVDGGAGNDTLSGDGGDDTVYGGAGNDVLSGGAGQDVLDGGSGQDTIDGGAQDDTIHAGSGDDSVSGGDGNDVIHGDSGGSDGLVRESFEWDQAPNADHFTQDTGNVNVTFTTLQETGSAETYLDTTTQNVDNIQSAGETVDDNSSLHSETHGRGNEADYQLSFSDPVQNTSFRINDIDGDGVVRVTAYDADGHQIEVDLQGGSGLTLLDTDSVAGADTADSRGGYQAPTTDTYSLEVNIPGPVSRIVIEHDQDGHYNTGINVTDIYYDVPTADAGEAGDDTLMGDAGDDIIHGEGGDDMLGGGTGNDTLEGGSGDDTLSGGAGSNHLSGGSGDDVFIGGDGADTFNGGAGQDNIDYSGSDAAVQVDLSTSTLSGGDAGNDHIAGGIDGVIGSQFGDTLTGFDQQGTNPADTYTNEFYGEGGNDTITGLGGDDRLYGGTGDDSISGGGGADLMEGGDDRDTFADITADDTIHGGAGGDDVDTLDLTGAGAHRFTDITTDSDGNGKDGTIEFLDGDGNVTGTAQFTNIEEGVPCFTPGTVIATPQGERLVEDLHVGDRVITRDNGLQEICWTGRRDLSAEHLTRAPKLRPVLIRAGALGRGLPEHDMLVSPQHRVLLMQDRAALFFEEREVLASAKHLTDMDGIDAVDASGGTSYIHFMCERHEVVLSNGAWTESFQPGEQVMDGMGEAQRNEIFALFPDLKQPEGLAAYQAARRSLKRHEARLLVAG